MNNVFSNIALLKSELSKLGYVYETLILNNERHTIFTTSDGIKWFTHNERIAYPFTNSTVYSICKYKNIANDFAAALGVPTPSTQILTSYNRTVSTYKIDNYSSLIVKPNDLSLSKGLTINITDRIELENAIKYAFEFSDKILIQEQVYGEELRFVVINGRVRSVLYRQTPRIIGDGVNSIKKLVQQENEKRQVLLMPYLEYPQLTEDIVNKELINSLNIAAKGEIVELGKGTMIKNGASVYDIYNEVDKGYFKIVEHLAANLGVPYIAVDIITRNYNLKPKTGNYWFIEFNTNPVLRMFYSCRDGRMFDAFSELIPLIDEHLRTTSLKQN